MNTFEILHNIRMGYRQLYNDKIIDVTAMKSIMQRIDQLRRRAKAHEDRKEQRTKILERTSRRLEWMRNAKNLISIDLGGPDEDIVTIASVYGRSFWITRDMQDGYTEQQIKDFLMQEIYDCDCFVFMRPDLVLKYLGLRLPETIRFVDISLLTSRWEKTFGQQPGLHKIASILGYKPEELRPRNAQDDAKLQWEVAHILRDTMPEKGDWI